MNIHFTRVSALASAASVFALAATGILAPLPAHAETPVPDVTAQGLVLSGTNGSEVVELNDAQTQGTLYCVPGQEEYAIAYRGQLDMKPVVAKWNELKEQGRATAKELRPNWYAYDSTFAALKVSGSFQISFTIDPAMVTVDEQMATDVAAWDAAYKAGNVGSPFVNQMVIDTTKGAEYDPASGKFTVHFKLADGLTAGELDKTYADPNFTGLGLNTPAGLLSVSKDNYHAAIDSGDMSFDMVNASVTGTFDAPRYVGGDFILSFGISLAFGKIFPVTFGQPTPVPAVIELDKRMTVKYAYEVDPSVKEPLPASIVAPEPVTDVTEMPADPEVADVVTDDGIWSFVGWREQMPSTWNEDPKAAHNCFLASKVGTWTFTKFVTPDAPKFIEDPNCGVSHGVIYTDKPEYTYASVNNGGKVTFTAVPEKGYAIKPGADATWTFDVAATPCPPKEEKPVPPTVSKPVAPATVKPANPKAGGLAHTGASALALTGVAGLAGAAGVVVLRSRKRK